MRQIVADRVGKDEVAVGQSLHQRARAEPVGAVIGEIGFADREQSGDRAHQVVIHPQSAHRVVDRRIDPHRNFVGIFAGDALVHVEQIAVAFVDAVLAEPLDGIGEIQIDAEAGSPTPRPSSQTALALREATSRGTRLPKLGYLRSR